MHLNAFVDAYLGTDNKKMSTKIKKKTVTYWKISTEKNSKVLKTVFLFI